MEVKAAWIGAIAGSLAASIVSGTFTIVTVMQQVDADDRRSAAEFLRQEQKPVYAELIAAEEKLRGAERAVVGSLDAEPNLDDVHVKTGEVLEGMETLIDKLSSTKLVGSPEMIQKGNACLAAHNAYLAAINVAYSAILQSGRPGSEEMRSRVQANLTQGEEFLDSAAQDLTNQAREDFGAEAIPNEGEGDGG